MTQGQHGLELQTPGLTTCNYQQFLNTFCRAFFYCHCHQALERKDNTAVNHMVAGMHNCNHNPPDHAVAANNSAVHPRKPNLNEKKEKKKNKVPNSPLLN
uniref:E3 ubiquitin-protein ligase RGLG2 n=1 Tax=Rhizophora mucronata TaxID=61149 RepID=A0A2P2LX42_RHIMU